MNTEQMSRRAKDLAVAIGLVMQLLVQTVVIAWWGSKLTTTVEQVVVELRSVRSAQGDNSDAITELKIRLAVQEALTASGIESGKSAGGGTP